MRKSGTLGHGFGFWGPEKVLGEKRSDGQMVSEKQEGGCGARVEKQTMM